MCVVFLYPFLLFFLAFCEFLLFLSCVLYFALWLLLRVCAVVHCPPLWGSSSAFVYLALLLVACCAFSIRLGALLLVSYGFLCGFLFILMHFLPFLRSYVVCLFHSLCFSVVHSPLAVRLHPSSSLLRLCGCLAWRSSASAPSPLGRCVYGDSSSPGSLPYRSLCLWC